MRKMLRHRTIKQEQTTNLRHDLENTKFRKLIQQKECRRKS